MPDNFICPICGITLNKTDNSFKCEKNHCFDISKEGYVNLLTKGGKKGHGDDKLMVKARHDFLYKGYYSHFKDTVKKEIEKTAFSDCCLLDSGCGEGYYTSEFYSVLKKKHGEMYGIDVSKNALKLAAKVCPNVKFAVASAYCLPFEKKSFDVIVSLFAPLALSEFQRVLKNGGFFVTAVPLEKHLMGLKKAVYDTPYLNKPEDTELEGFELVNSVEIKKEITLKNNEDIKNLFMMTPYYYKTSSADQKKLDNLNELVTKTEFLVLTYKKKGNF